MATATHLVFVTALSLAGLAQGVSVTKQSPTKPQAESSVSDREKWETEKAFRAHEVALKEREQLTKEADLKLRETEQATARWQNPLIVAIIAAALAALGNAVLAFVNGRQQRQLEAEKSEQQRVLEMIKTGNADKVAENLEFLLAAGLVSEPGLTARLQKFLGDRVPGSGPSLPSSSYDREHPSFRDISPDWLADSKLPDESVNAIWVRFTSKAKKTYLAVHVFKHPSGPYILLSSKDRDRDDFKEVVATLAEAYRGTPEGKISERSSDICEVISVPDGFTQKGVAEKVDSFFRPTFDGVAIQEAHY